jgi:hypothetical protein
MNEELIATLDKAIVSPDKMTIRQIAEMFLRCRTALSAVGEPVAQQYREAIDNAPAAKETLIPFRHGNIKTGKPESAASVGTLTERIDNVIARLELTDEGDRVDVTLTDAANVLKTCRTILGDLPQDAIDGGWTAAGICAYAKSLEDRLAAPAVDSESAASVGSGERTGVTVDSIKLSCGQCHAPVELGIAHTCAGLTAWKAARAAIAESKGVV